MSRDYYCRVDCCGIDKYHGGFDLNPIDKIWITMIKNCSHPQILKIEEHSEDGVTYDYTIHYIMGCSGGVHPQDSLDEMVKQLKREKGVKVTGAYVWSLHPDKIEAEYPDEGDV